MRLDVPDRRPEQGDPRHPPAAEVELALDVGVVAYASIKATNVVVGLDDVRSAT